MKAVKRRRGNLIFRLVTVKSGQGYWMTFRSEPSRAVRIAHDR